jgi:hypothetical protein
LKGRGDFGHVAIERAPLDCAKDPRSSTVTVITGATAASSQASIALSTSSLRITNRQAFF